MTTLRAAPLGVFTALLVLQSLGACVPPEVACTLEARASLAIRVVDDAGAGVDSANVSAASGSAPAELCEASGSDGDYACPFFELAGDFVVTVEAGAFRRTEQVSVGQTDDGCHVVTEALTFQVPQDTGCCCAFIREGDFDIISEAPASSSAECLERDQGACVDPDVISQRLTPHPCCPGAAGERCGD